MVLEGATPGSFSSEVLPNRFIFFADALVHAFFHLFPLHPQQSPVVIDNARSSTGNTRSMPRAICTRKSRGAVHDLVFSRDTQILLLLWREFSQCSKWSSEDGLLLKPRDSPESTFAQRHQLQHFLRRIVPRPLIPRRTTLPMHYPRVRQMR